MLGGGKIANLPLDIWYHQYFFTAENNHVIRETIELTHSIQIKYL